MSESATSAPRLSRLGFSGDVVDFYHRYRRGYPPEVVDVLAALGRRPHFAGRAAAAPAVR